MRHSQKRVVVREKEKDVLMRVTQAYAEILVAKGTHTFTTKGKLKCFLGREARIHRNNRSLASYGNLKTNEKVELIKMPSEKVIARVTHEIKTISGKTAIYMQHHLVGYGKL